MDVHKIHCYGSTKFLVIIVKGMKSRLVLNFMTNTFHCLHRHFFSDQVARVRIVKNTHGTLHVIVPNTVPSQCNVSKLNIRPFRVYTPIQDKLNKESI